MQARVPGPGGSSGGSDLALVLLPSMGGPLAEPAWQLGGLELESSKVQSLLNSLAVARNSWQLIGGGTESSQSAPRAGSLCRVRSGKGGPVLACTLGPLSITGHGSQRPLISQSSDGSGGRGGGDMGKVTCRSGAMPQEEGRPGSRLTCRLGMSDPGRVRAGTGRGHSKPLVLCDFAGHRGAHGGLAGGAGCCCVAGELVPSRQDVFGGIEEL